MLLYYLSKIWRFTTVWNGYWFNPPKSFLAACKDLLPPVGLAIAVRFVSNDSKGSNSIATSPQQLPAKSPSGSHLNRSREYTSTNFSQPQIFLQNHKKRNKKISSRSKLALGLPSPAQLGSAVMIFKTHLNSTWKALLRTSFLQFREEKKIKERTLRLKHCHKSTFWRTDFAIILLCWHPLP